MKLAGAISGDLTDSLSVKSICRLEVGGCDITDGPEWIAEKQPPVAPFEYHISVWCARP